MKRTNPLISIIVPVYNKEAYLRECVGSILAQTYRRIEVILVDDESADKSGAICDEFGQADTRVQVIHQKNGGPTAACVAGMERALGGYYMFVDSDDYLEPETLTQMADRLADVPGEIVCCDHVVEKQRGTEGKERHRARHLRGKQAAGADQGEANRGGEKGDSPVAVYETV